MLHRNSILKVSILASENPQTTGYSCYNLGIFYKVPKFYSLLLILYLILPLTTIILFYEFSQNKKFDRN